MKLLSRGLLLAGILIVGACEDRRAAEGSISSSSRAIEGLITVHGRVSDDQAHAIAGATIAFLGGGADAAIAQTTAGADAGLDGTYSIDIVPGTYTVIVTPPSASLLQPITLTGQEFDSDLRFDVVLTPEAVILSGHVLDQSGSPMAGVSVGWGSASATNDSSGFYQVNVLPGDHSLSIHRAFTVSSPGSTLLYDYWISGYSVHVAGNTTFDATLPTPKTLSGQVVDADGTSPVAGASVGSSGTMPATVSWSITLPGVGPDGGAGPISGSQSFSSTTDGNGRFQFLVFPGGGGITVRIVNSPWRMPPFIPVNDLTEDTYIVIAVPFISNSGSGGAGGNSGGAGGGGASGGAGASGSPGAGGAGMGGTPGGVIIPSGSGGNTSTGPSGGAGGGRVLRRQPRRLDARRSAAERDRREGRARPRCSKGKGHKRWRRNCAAASRPRRSGSDLCRSRHDGAGSIGRWTGWRGRSRAGIARRLLPRRSV